MPRFRKTRNTRKRPCFSRGDSQTSVEVEAPEIFTRIKPKNDLYDEIKEEPEEEQNNRPENDNVQQCSNEQSWLDVLAEVATETLKQEPKSEPEDEDAEAEAEEEDVPLEQPPKFPLSTYSRKKFQLTKRAVTTMELLTLDQIRELTDKVLIEMFAELSCDEIKKTYTFKCMLVPDRCRSNFSSYGSELRAKQSIRSHLVNHVSELIDEANDPASAKKARFTAEPVPARKKRFYAEKMAAKSARKTQRKEKANYRVLAKKSKKDSAVSTATMTSNLGQKMLIATEGSQKYKKVKYKRKTNFTHKKRRRSSTFQDPLSEDEDELEEGEDFIEEDQESKEMASGENKGVTDKVKVNENKNTDGKSDNSNEENNNNNRDTALKIIEQNQEFVKNLMARCQPHMDHCYTSIFGKKRFIDKVECNPETDEETEDDKTRGSSRTMAFSKNQRSGPFKWLMLTVCPTCPDSTDKNTNTEIPVDGTQLTVSQALFSNKSSVEIDGTTSVPARPYPPMPKTNWALKGYIPIPEEEPTSSEDEMEIENEDEELTDGSDVRYVRLKSKKRTDFTKIKWHYRKFVPTESERMQALQMIRELRKSTSKAKVLACKICESKSITRTFTANATLMYHYRSHAGIKPFVCLVCSKTFTRQHSLNYHMLIHNNQSRFTCKDCGRKFRHPSHFKEHIRRHTGETPFECADCILKFKTRNTYKRHLKTRHMKLLTADGIYDLKFDKLKKVHESEDKDKRDDDLKPGGYIIENCNKMSSLNPSASLVKGVSVSGSSSKPTDNKDNDKREDTALDRAYRELGIDSSVAANLKSLLRAPSSLQLSNGSISP